MFDPGADPAVIAQTFLEADRPKALTGLRKVTIADFRVAFAVENNGKASSSSNAGTSTVKSHILLRGNAAEVITGVFTGLATGITRQFKRENANAAPDVYAAGIERYGGAYYKAVAQALRANSVA